MKDVKALLKQRDDLFVEQTDMILDCVEETLDGISEYLSSVDPSYISGYFSWEDISIFDELLMLIGLVSYEPNTSFILDGEMIEITEENKDYFNRVLRIGIPLSVVEQQSKKAVIDFLISLHNAVIEDLKDEAENLPNLVQSENVDDYEFDLDELSDDQLAALKLSGGLGKIN